MILNDSEKRDAKPHLGGGGGGGQQAARMKQWRIFGSTKVKRIIIVSVFKKYY
jgi:hypothetical protein